MMKCMITDIDSAIMIGLLIDTTFQLSHIQSIHYKFNYLKKRTSTYQSGYIIWFRGRRDASIDLHAPQRPVTVHLFRFEEHWMPIVNLSALYRSNRQGNYYKCTKCFKSFYNLENYNRHLA